MKIGILCNSKLSIPSIQYLVQSGHQVALLTASDNPTDHEELFGFANYFQLPVLNVKKDRLDDEVLFWSASNQFDVLFIITFPHILSAQLIDSVKVEIINFHFAPLPEFKGAQPAFWLIKNGEKRGGVTAHVITVKIDQGPIVHFEPYNLSKTETFGSYLYKMAQLNVTVIQKVLQIFSGTSWKEKLSIQESSKAKYYPRPQLADIRINWQSMTALDIERLCRACNPWNKGAITTLNNSPIKLIEVELLSIPFKGEKAGQLIKTIANELAVACADGIYLKLMVVYEENLGFYSGEHLQELNLKAGLVLV